MVKHEKMGTTLRVAGGWVRDKLVGQEQGFHQRHLSRVDKMDIDIALDNCMGGDFAAKLSRYLSEVRAGVGCCGCLSLVLYAWLVSGAVGLLAALQ